MACAIGSNLRFKTSTKFFDSSISHGSQALDYIDSYAFLLSRLLNINVLNKSLPSSC